MNTASWVRDSHGAGRGVARWRPVGAIAAGVLLLAACGTRLDDEEFVAAQSSPLVTEGSGEGATLEGGASVDEDGLSPALDPEAAEEGGDEVDAGAGAAGGAAGGGDGAAEADGGEQADDGDGQPAEAADNVASDVGVTQDTIRVGNIASRGGPLGPHVFGPMFQGANAYFQMVNNQGGVHGRQIDFETCDDRESTSRNIACVEQLIGDQEVFALVANATRTYDSGGAPIVVEEGVPDVGSQPVGNAYFRHPNLYAVLGSSYPRDGEIGFDGSLWASTTEVRAVIDRFDLDTVAVVYYNEPSSKAAGSSLFARALELEGVEVVEYEVPLVNPDFNSQVADMQQRGVQAIWNAMDLNANRNLCRSIVNEGLDQSLRAFMGTAQVQSQRVREFPDGCRQLVHTTGLVYPYGDTGNDEVARFQDVMGRIYGQDYLEEQLHQWAFEGWLGAKLFTEGVASMGPEPTREGLMEWLDSLSPEGDGDPTFTGGGSVANDGITYQPQDFSEGNQTEGCTFLAGWDDDAQTFLLDVPLEETCRTGTTFRWQPGDA
jgi:ABC-type branched-subunit amino acid transport system substrate-binding protein